MFNKNCKKKDGCLKAIMKISILIEIFYGNMDIDHKNLYKKILKITKLIKNMKHFYQL